MEPGKTSCKMNKNLLGLPKGQNGGSLACGPRQPMQARETEKTALDPQLWQSFAGSIPTCLANLQDLCTFVKDME